MNISKSEILTLIAIVLAYINLLFGYRDLAFFILIGLVVASLMTIIEILRIGLKK